MNRLELACDGVQVGLRISPDGNYILYSDHLAEITKLQSTLAKKDKEINWHRDNAVELIKEITRLKAENEGLEVDNEIVRDALYSSLYHIEEILEPEISKLQDNYDSKSMNLDYVCNVFDRLKHRFKELEVSIQQHRGALGYSVPGSIRENPDIINGIAEALLTQYEALETRLKESE